MQFAKKDFCFEQKKLRLKVKVLLSFTNSIITVDMEMGGAKTCLTDTLDEE